MIAGEGVSNIRTVAAFNAQDKILSRFKQELVYLRPIVYVEANRQDSSLAFPSCSFMGLKLSSSGMVHTLSEQVLQFFRRSSRSSLSWSSLQTLAETVSLAPEIISGGESIRSVFSILDRVTRIDPDNIDSETVDSVPGEIELRHVDFVYPSRPDIMIFKDFSLRIRAGQSQALVGSSGSGKSSVIGLIERFYDPTAGKVMIDGKDIRRLNLKSVRLKIGLVQQEPALFATSIFENIAYCKDGATEEEVIKAARSANIHEFISSLPDAYKTAVGERGMQLSGGQKQRIAIARSVLKDPSVLLLDEATSALDAESESMLQEALERLMKGRTTVLIAHRLSTIRGVDCISVIQDGRIIEQGSHSELVSRTEGAYSRLLQLQHHR